MLLISLIVICLGFYIGILAGRTIIRKLKENLIISYGSIFALAVFLLMITAAVYVVIAINLSGLHASPPETPFIGWLLFLFLTVLPVAGLLFLRSYQKTKMEIKKTGISSGKKVLLGFGVIFILIFFTMTVFLSGRLAMILALKHNDVAAVKFLLDTGISSRMNIVASGEKRQPLHYAAMKGSSEMAGLLISKGADVNIEGVLIDAVIGGNPEVVRLLLNAGTDPNQGGGDSSPLMWAVKKRSIKMISILLDHGANIDFINSQDMTALDMAGHEKDEEIVRFLLSRGAREKLSSPQRERALFSAIGGKDINKTQRLLDKGADVNCLNDLKQTPLIQAVMYRNSEAVRLLLKHGAKIDIKDVNKRSALDIARENRYTDMEQLLRGRR